MVPVELLLLHFLLLISEKVGHQGVRVPVADLMLEFKQIYQRYVLQIASCLQDI